MSFRGRVRLIRAADRVFLGAYRHLRFIVDLASIYRRFSGPLGRRYIDDMSTTFQLNVTFLFISCVQASVKCFRCPGLKGSHLRGAGHQTSQHSRPDAPSQVAVRVTVRPSPWPREGPLGSSRAASGDQTMSVDFP